MRIGIDVGGTHTDAVIFNGRTLIAANKAQTSEDISGGVLETVRAVLSQSSVSASEIELVTLGTTQFTNAVVQRRGLSPVGVLRIGAQSSSAMPVAAKWPKDIGSAVVSASHMVDGGYQYSGLPIVPTDTRALENATESMKRAGLTSFAVTSVFSTSNHAAELEAAALIRDHIPGARIALSHQIGSIGLHQRENATLLNAALLDLSEVVITAFEQAFRDLDFKCPIFISQNDGTLMAADFARAFPVFTFSSGPTNSMRGAAFLSGMKDAMVVDVGGTTSDIGMLIDGFPRPSGVAVKIGGVLTNFRMPDVLAVGLGGGSLVSDGGGTVGPQSVGRDLAHRGLVFGGDTLTATDVAVALGRAEIGDREKVQQLDPQLLAAASVEIKRLLTENVDRMKTSAAPLPLIVVGGGGFLVADDLDGVSETIHPPYAGVANAIGAAFAQIGGEAETVYIASRTPRADALEEAKRQAMDRAIAAGALPDRVEIAEIEEVPMSYLEEPGAVIRVKAVGEADIGRFSDRRGTR